MIRVALPGHDIALLLNGALLLRARADLARGVDTDALGLALLALGLTPTREPALMRLASGWTLAQVGAEALDTLVAAGHPVGPLLSLAAIAAQAVLSPVSPATPVAPPAPPAEPPLLPVGMAIDGIPWQQASMDGAQPGADPEQVQRRAQVADAIRAHREGRLGEWAASRPWVSLP